MCLLPQVNPVNPCMGIIQLLMNIFLPGTGTMLNGLFGAMCCDLLLAGLCQLLLAVIIVGWVCSVITGCRIMGGGSNGGVHYREVIIIKS